MTLLTLPVRTERPDHLDAGTIAALVDGLLDETTRSSAELHLAWCEECRREFVAVQSLAPPRRQSHRVSWTTVSLAAAAVVLLVVSGPAVRRVLERQAMPAADRAPVLRPAAVSVTLPPPGSTVERDSSLHFAWNAPDSGHRFRLVLTDDRGETVWEAETGDTTATLPAGIALVASRTYFWYVDALGADGRTITSGIQQFSVR